MTDSWNCYVSQIKSQDLSMKFLAVVLLSNSIIPDQPNLSIKL